MTQELLRNRTFDEIATGETASLVHIVRRDIDLFAAVSGDVKPAHLGAARAPLEVPA